jgi:hypothetical protein
MKESSIASGKIYFVSEGQITSPTGTGGLVAMERNATLLFSGELDKDHYALLLTEEKERLIIF